MEILFLIIQTGRNHVVECRLPCFVCEGRRSLRDVLRRRRCDTCDGKGWYDPAAYPRLNPDLRPQPGQSLVYVVCETKNRSMLDAFEVIVLDRSRARYGRVTISDRERHTGSGWRHAGEELTGNQLWEIATRRVDWYPRMPTNDRRPFARFAWNDNSTPPAGDQVSLPASIPDVVDPSHSQVQDACDRARAERLTLALNAGWPEQVAETSIVATPLAQPRRHGDRWMVGLVRDATIERDLLVYLSDDLQTPLIDSPASDADHWNSRCREFPVDRDGEPLSGFRFWIGGVDATPEEAIKHARLHNVHDVRWVRVEP